MTVYRITLDIHAHRLVASGNPARWNSRDVFVIYTSSSRALACLENIVHRNSRGLNKQFRTVLIDIPTGIKMETVERSKLPAGWTDLQSFSITQQIGDEWVSKGKTAVLRVPSVIIPEEHNFILNPAHKDFHKIKLTGAVPFEFDGRL